MKAPKVQVNSTTLTINYADVMEAVAHDTNGPEPSREATVRWLTEHSAGLDEAMWYAAREYIRRHWKENNDGETKT